MVAGSGSGFYNKRAKQRLAESKYLETSAVTDSLLIGDHNLKQLEDGDWD